VHLVGFIIRIYYDARSLERQNRRVKVRRTYIENLYTSVRFAFPIFFHIRLI